MQPYFFPYLGYFSLIRHTNKFILFDTVQFIKHGWIERNRILKPNFGWQYIGVPLVKHSRDTKINDIAINDNFDWRDKILRQLEHYKKRAPFYRQTIELVREALNIETQSIVKLNENILKVVCNSMNIDLDVEIFSEMDLSINNPNEPDEWALNICKSIGNIEEYWNPEGGLKFFNCKKYEEEGIKINFLKMNLWKYSQRRKEFETGLSIIDVMMFNEINEINKMLDDYELL
ncbi:WbqC family protein [Alkaliphilus sp. MSJ-5]|uniref:WbqC family protein n=2 Tax=Alkaliphilus flagellatus TaxID=2841507 RepID=A0ABS6G2G3_9FIRM|nr:WbqC family protein [Alkaliphilus flagellatus]